MLTTIIGTKDYMDQTYAASGMRVPVTVVKAGPCVVTQIKTKDKDGYWAVQVGLGEKKLKHTSKQLQGHFNKAKAVNIKTNKAPRYLQEIKIEDEPELKVGDSIFISDIFSVGDVVKVTGTSKGKGFAGGVKRWGFKGGSKTHGQSDRHRAPGSIGQGTSPGRVWKGKKMAGRLGNETVTVDNLKIVGLDAEKNLLMISGPIPGTRGTLITIKRTSPKQEKVESEQKE